jgi:hypothetical protein
MGCYQSRQAKLVFDPSEMKTSVVKKTTGNNVSSKEKKAIEKKNNEKIHKIGKLLGL